MRMHSSTSGLARGVDFTGTARDAALSGMLVMLGYGHAPPSRTCPACRRDVCRRRLGRVPMKSPCRLFRDFPASLSVTVRWTRVTGGSTMSYRVPSMKSNQPGSCPTWEAAMTAAPARESTSSVELTEMSAAEWKAAVKRGLDRIGLTYDELADQAKTRDFSSVEALKLWVAIGGKRP